MGKPRTEESRELSRTRANAFWADPARRKAHGEKTRARMNRPEVRAKIAENTKIALADPEVKERQRSALRTAMADPVVRQKISERTKAAMADPTVRQKISEGTKAGKAAKMDRRFADLIKVWSETPANIQKRFIDHVRAGWGPDVPL